MAAKAAPPDTPDTIKVHTMTKGTRSLNVLRRVMESIVRAGPLLWVGIVRSVTVFARVVTKTDIKARVAARPSQFSMTRLTGGQVDFGIWTMAATLKITSIQSMRHLSGSIGMTAAAAKAVRVTARHRLSAPQIMAMTAGA